MSHVKVWITGFLGPGVPTKLLKAAQFRGSMNLSPSARSGDRCGSTSRIPPSESAYLPERSRTFSAVGARRRGFTDVYKQPPSRLRAVRGYPLASLHARGMGALR